MDGFHCGYLTEILGVPNAYISRVSDVAIFHRGGSALLRHKLLKQQLLLYGRIARLPGDDILRRSILMLGDVRLAYLNFR